MFTPEDERDELDTEIGRYRHRLFMAERAELDGRVTDRELNAVWIRGLRERIRTLEHQRAQIDATEMTS